MMNHEENLNGDQVPNSHNQGAGNNGTPESEHPLITKLKNEIVQLQQSLEIRIEENKYLRMQLHRLDKGMRTEKFQYIPNLRPMAKERRQQYVFGYSEEDFIPKLQLRKQLLRRHPLLTSQDIDLSIMLSIGLTNKEIMILSGKSHSTIENNASTLKSKLFGIDQQRDIRTYLFSLELDAITDSTREFSVDKILKQHNINLSHTECKVCGMIVLRMRNKDICETLMISPRTLESHKYRIKKKCGLSRHESLTAKLHMLIGPYL
jgi:DNA-binding CsgD family transcriptional regulator